MNKLSTKTVKTFLSNLTKISEKNLKRDSKQKNELKEILRTFIDTATEKEIHNPAHTVVTPASSRGIVMIEEYGDESYTESINYIVISDPTDSKIVCVLKEDQNVEEDEIVWQDEAYYSAQKQELLSKAKDYVFIITNDLEDPDNEDFYVGFSTHKQFEKHKGDSVYLEVPHGMSNKDFNTLSTILELPNKLNITFVTLAEPPIFEFFVSDKNSKINKKNVTRKDMHDLLISMGFQYSSELAKATNLAAKDDWDGEWDILGWQVDVF